MILTIFIAFCIGYVIVKKYLTDQKYADFYSIHGSKTLPLIGNALMFISSPKATFETQIRLAKMYDGFYRLIIGQRKILVLGKPEHVESILQSMTHTKKSASYDTLFDFLGNGLINSHGEHWRKHRKIITPTFHYKILQNYAISISNNLEVLLGVLKEQNSKIINIFALDNICESAMRFKLHSQLHANSEYVNSIKGYLHIYIQRCFSILFRIPLFFKLSMLERTQLSYVKIMKSFTESIIITRKAERETSNQHSTSEKHITSFLDHLLDQQDSDKMFTDEDVRDEVNTFIFAGHDTVSSCISFCLYELSAHPEVQQKLVEESWKVMGKNTDVSVNLTNISSLTYLDAVMKECMRLYTIVPFIERELGEDAIINQKRIPKGTTIQISNYAIHHDPNYYPEPDKFDPERFSTANSTGRHPFAHIPFSAGPRNCIGLKYGILISKAAVIHILRSFIVTRPDDEKLKPILFNNSVLESANGIHINLEKREI